MQLDSKTLLLLKQIISSNINTSAIRHFEPSLICSTDNGEVSGEFFELIWRAVGLAKKVNIDIPNPALSDSMFYNIFPGEHYRFLKALTKTLRAKSVIEIGTFTGMGSVAISQGFDSRNNELLTFDVIPYDQFQTHFTPELLKSSKFSQIIGDLADVDFFKEHIQRFNNCELIFLDAPKDGIFEYKFLENLMLVKPVGACYLVLDDIRFLNMTELWQSIQSEKLDCTSFGHWSGTGVVNITGGLKLR